MLASVDGDTMKARWLLLEFVGAGSDTIASLLVHTLYHLARRPGLEQNLRNEIKLRMPSGRKLLSRMEFLDSLIKESMFFNPSAQLNITTT